MKMRRIFAILVTLLLVINVWAGGNAEASSTAQDAGPKEIVLRVGIDADPGTLAPFVKSGSGFATISYTLYEYLGELSRVGGVLEGYIMKEYKEVAPLVYEVTIYDYVYDTAGNHITADDVIFSIAKMKEMGGSGNMRYIDSFEKVSDYTIRLKLNANFVGGLNKVIASCRIVSKKAFEASKDGMATTPIGTTGYELEKYVPGSVVRFRKTNNHWQKDASKLATLQAANPDVIEYKIIKESAQMAIALETKTIDLAVNMSYIDAQRFMDNKAYTVFQNASNITNQMYLNLDTDSVFYNNLPLRMAVLRSIDKQGLVKGAVSGYGAPLKDFGSNHFPDFNPKWENEDYNDYDPAKAKALLAEAGYKPNELTLRIMTDNTPIRNKVAQMIQGYLMATGIKSTILQYDQALFNNYKIDTKDKYEWDIMLDNTGSSDYLVSMYRAKFDSRQYSNGTTNGVKDETLQKYVDRANALDGHSAEDVDNLHYYMKEQAYAMGLFSHITFMVGREGIEQLTYDPKCYPAPANTVFNAKY
jgi:ABC-type transport system substrate-binding protein